MPSPPPPPPPPFASRATTSGSRSRRSASRRRRRRSTRARSRRARALPHAAGRGPHRTVTTFSSGVLRICIGLTPKENTLSSDRIILISGAPLFPNDGGDESHESMACSEAQFNAFGGTNASQPPRSNAARSFAIHTHTCHLLRRYVGAQAGRGGDDGGYTCFVVPIAVIRVRHVTSCAGARAQAGRGPRRGRAVALEPRGASLRADAVRGRDAPLPARVRHQGPPPARPQWWWWVWRRRAVGGD